MYADFEHALNDGKVTVIYWYELDDPEYNKIISVQYKGVDISEVMNPEDYDYFLDMLYEKAVEDMEDMKECMK